VKKNEQTNCNNRVVIQGKVVRVMAIATMKLLTIESFRTQVRSVEPFGAIARGHAAPIFRRLQS